MMDVDESFELPEYLLVYTSDASSSGSGSVTPGQFSWFEDKGKRKMSGPPRAPFVTASTKSCGMIVQGIERYYSRQVLEPSIRGFLAILEKQFPRNDLYLFELLQNSVDDGATHVIFAARGDNRSKNVPPNQGRQEEGIFFHHNGRPFTALDCLGLASVGLSTKGSGDSGAKRTIGFMGVGFKSVYKRFMRVTIYDDEWCFRFEEPVKPVAMEPTHAFVLKPQWVTDRSSLWDASPTSSTYKWCHFQLERPRQAGSAISDLRYLPSTVPALLGRQALENQKFRISQAIVEENPGEWMLEWDQETHNVTQSSQMKFTFRSKIDVNNSWDSSGERVHDKIKRVSSSSASVKTWQFITVHYVPSKAALDAYTVHTKKAWANGSGTSQYEECSFFFEIGADGSPVLPSQSSSSSSKGSIHAVLPTKLKISTPMQWQGSWLLSVDRQEVQNVTDNAWNNCILAQAPRLLGSLFLWVATSKPNLRAAYSLLPPIVLDDPDNAFPSKGSYNSKAQTSKRVSTLLLGILH